MKCPHCEMDIPDNSAECSWCGLILAKWRAAQARPAVIAETQPPPPPVYAKAMDWVKQKNLLVPLAGAFIPAVWAAARFPHWMPAPEGWYTFESWLFPLAFCDLAVHEAGHVVFTLTGIDFLRVLGGTLLQLIMPALFLRQFIKQGQKWGIAFTLFWIGFSLGDISYYMSDAKAQVLILISGLSGSDGGGHDWHYLLGRLGLLDQSMRMGTAVMFFGAYVMGFAVLMPFFVKIKDRKPERAEEMRKFIMGKSYTPHKSEDGPAI